MSNSNHDLSRQALLRKVGLLGLAAAGVATPTPAAADADAARPGQTYPFHGLHQAGIVTPAQDHVYLAAFDLIDPDKASFVGLLSGWSKTAATLSGGEPAGNPGAPGFNPLLPPTDTGEAMGIGAARLTVTIGFGPNLFEKVRFGHGAERPAPLAPLPSFPHDELDPAYCGGDLVVQACADNPQVAFHAIRMLTRNGRGIVAPRWTQQGFLPARETKGTPRNLMGFKDGTGNLKVNDPAAMAEHMWVGSPDAPEWMRGGSYMVVRRIRMQLENWDHATLQVQEDTFGRQKITGAPLGAPGEFAPINVRAVDKHGAPLMPATSHVRLAHQGPERILRRGYSFSDGLDPITGGLEAGLLFISFQRDPRRQFVPLQMRLATLDALNEYILHTGSAIFACPPGAPLGGYVGEGLLKL